MLEESDNVLKWLDMPLTNEKIRSMKNRTIFWSFLAWVLLLGNVEITTLLFIKFIEPISKFELIPVIILIASYQFVLWATNQYDYYKSHKASRYIARFLDLEQALIRIKENSGMLQSKDIESIQRVFRIFDAGSSQLLISRKLTKSNFIIFDVLIPVILFATMIVKIFLGLF